MISWISAAIIGLMIAALHYGRSLRDAPGAGSARVGGRRIDPRWVAAILRALAAMLIAAMVLAAPSGRATPARPLVVLDVSTSWTRADPARGRWARAVATTRSLAAGDSILLFGDSVRGSDAVPLAPRDEHSAIGPVLDAARDAHRQLMIVSDGEFTGGATLPPGTRLTTIAGGSAIDAAIATIDAPERVAPGDTISLRVTVRAGSRPVAAATVNIGFASGPSTIVRLPPLGAFAEGEAVARLVAPRGERDELLRAAVATAGDAEPRNDTLATIVEITRVPAAVLVSSSPDPDARAALEALSGALVARPRGFYQVAPGAWRDATTLRAVSAGEVRAVAQAAPLLVLHGDTAILGAPAQVARSAVVLMVPGDATDVEWRATSGDPSPLAPSLAGIAWDSIPPVELPAVAPRGEWTALAARSVGVASRAVVVGGEAAGHRRLVVAASGLWRWRARGGPSRDAYDALWGAIADWTTNTPVDVRAALPARRWLRAGDPVEWIRTGTDSVVAMTLRRSGAGVAATDTAGRELTLHFPGGARTTTSPSLNPGVYVAAMRGGSTSFVVNGSSELLPTRPANHEVARGGGPGGLPAPPLGARWWPYVLALAALCGEWIIRRRAGLR
ncbi:MAG: hypothetical protein ACJ79K_08630 [Gemmatimonadaceae bacterium]